MGDTTTEITAKPGWQTTEFYVTALTAMLPILTAVFHRSFTNTQVQGWATMAAAIASGCYAFSRAHSKQAVMTAKVAAMAPRVETEPTQPPSAGLAAVPIDTLAHILARLDELAQHTDRHIVATTAPRS